MKRALLCVTLGVALLTFLSAPAFANPGDLDGSFGTGGLVRSDITPKNDSAIGVAVQGDGKIVVVGTGGAPNSKFQVARYNTNGTPDTSFGGGTGHVSIDFSTAKDVGIAVAIQGDDKIVVAGGVATNTSDAKWGIARLTADGSLDTTGFGTGGKTVVNLAKNRFDEPYGIGVQSTGRIIATGGVAADGSNPDFAVAGLTSAGVLDPTFGSGGITRTDFNSVSYDWGQGNMVVQSDDKIVVGGYTINASKPSDAMIAMARYTSAGALDSSFSGDGKFTLDTSQTLSEYVSGLAMDGTKIVGAGEAGIGGLHLKAAVVRVTSNGTLDSSFGGGQGWLTTDYGSNEDFAGGVAVDGTGRIVTGGGVDVDKPNSRFAVCRYLDNGDLDGTFAGGEVFTDFGPHVDYANTVAIGGDGNVVAIGNAGGGSGNSKFALARYLSS
jgi:uncharacterized delta-60 repeat protein